MVEDLPELHAEVLERTHDADLQTRLLALLGRRA